MIPVLKLTDPKLPTVREKFTASHILAKQRSKPNEDQEGGDERKSLSDAVKCLVQKKRNCKLKCQYYTMYIQ